MAAAHLRMPLACDVKIAIWLIGREQIQNQLQPQESADRLDAGDTQFNGTRNDQPISSCAKLNRFRQQILCAWPFHRAPSSAVSQERSTRPAPTERTA
jgi:hypothetical protein